MKIISGIVLEGRIVIEGEPLPEGEKVTILAPEGDETFDVSAEEKRLLLESMRQAARGQFVEVDDLHRERDEAR